VNKKRVLKLAMAFVIAVNILRMVEVPQQVEAYDWYAERDESIAQKEIPAMPKGIKWKEYPDGSKEQKALADWVRDYVFNGFMETPEGKIMGAEYVRKFLDDTVIRILNEKHPDFYWGGFWPDFHGPDMGEIRLSDDLRIGGEGDFKDKEKPFMTHECGHALTDALSGQHWEAHAEWLRRQIGLVYGYNYFNYVTGEENMPFIVDALAKIVGQEWYWNYFKRGPEARARTDEIKRAEVGKRFEEKQNVLTWEQFFLITFQSHDYLYFNTTLETAQKVRDWIYYIADHPKFNAKDKTHAEIREFFNNALAINPLLIKQFEGDLNMIDPLISNRDRVKWLTERIVNKERGPEANEALKSLINTTYLIPAPTKGGNIDNAIKDLNTDLPKAKLAEVTAALKVLEDAKKSASARAKLLAAVQAEELLFNSKGYAIRANEYKEELIKGDNASYAASHFARALEYSKLERQALLDAKVQLRAAGKKTDLASVDYSYSVTVIRDAQVIYQQAYMKKLAELKVKTPSKASKVNKGHAEFAGAYAKKVYLQAELVEMKSGSGKVYEAGFANTAKGKAAIKDIEKEIAALTKIVNKYANIDSASAWARDGIAGAIAGGYVPSDIQSNYTKVITRSEFCRMAVMWVENVTGKNIDEVLAEKGLTRDYNAFSDTKDPNILAAYALKITNGKVVPTSKTPGKFAPNDSFDREQAATVIRNTCRAIGVKVTGTKDQGFKDINKASSFAVDGINFCYANGIMDATSKNPLTFSPKAKFTREEGIATFFNIVPEKLLDFIELTGN